LHEYAESSEKNEMDYKIKGGNIKLAEKIAEKIGIENVKLNHRAIEIVQSDGKVTIICQNDIKFECDKIVCSIPTYSMSKIEWKPSLPQEKLDAVNQLQYARINKNVFLFDERFWRDESFDMVTDVYGHYFYHGTKNQKSKKGALISYSIGDKADVIHRQNKEFKKEVAVNSLKAAFGDVSDKILKQVNYYWGIDSYSKGAYAFYGKGQWFKIMPALKSPFLNVHFAGEHLADWQGFMEGAVNSGEEAAEEIMG
ncbi:MAG: flavin monoamine oxidase family protein, partial [Ignavibacteria bacterium]